MEQEYSISVVNGEYLPAAQAFAVIVAWLHSPEAKQKEHGEIESSLMRDGTELLRLMFQGHLDERAANEVALDEIVGADLVHRAPVRRHCSRQLESLFGTVQVRRLSYGAAGVGSLRPMDGQMNLPSDKYSHGIRRLVAEEAALVSFDETVKLVEKVTGGKVPKRQAEQLVVEAAQDFEAFYQQDEVDQTEGTDDPLVITMDGKGIVMRHDDLRDGTKKKAQQQQGKKKARLGTGEKRNRKRMATVAAVYTVARQTRTAEEIMNRGTTEQPQKEKPKARAKRVWASVERTPEKVTEEVFQEALDRDPERKREWTVLVDGDERQIKRIKIEGVQHRVALTIILDFIHVLEYLWKAAFCFYGENNPQTEAWVVARATRILNGQSSSVAAAMRRSATMRKMPTEKRAAVDKCAAYLLKYRKYLRYDEYLAKGLPIATGVIEGACRHLIKDRMDLTGARWGLERAEAVLKLRSMKSSGDFQAYWKFHQTEELKRNHVSRYESFPLPMAA